MAEWGGEGAHQPAAGYPQCDLSSKTNNNEYQATMNDMKTTTDDFEKLTAELGEFSRVSNELAKMDAEFQATMQELIAECFTKDFSGLQAELAAAE